MANANLHSAKNAKNDEFYTQYKDVEKEIDHYDLSGRVIYLPCDDYRKSNFWKFFEEHFDRLGLKGLYATCYGEDSVGASVVGGVKHVWKLDGDGDFRSDECKRYFDLCDTVITNPPFSLFREFFKLLVDLEKSFLVMGNMNAVTYKEIFPYIRNDKIWLGVNSNKVVEFILHESYEKWTRASSDGSKYGKVPAIIWLTNLSHDSRNIELELTKAYFRKNYNKFDNYDVINVDKTKDIPIDYTGAMGVPISFLCKYNPAQFDILHCDDYITNHKTRRKSHGLIKDMEATIDGKATYARVVIRHSF